MTALDRFYSLDETIRGIKEEHSTTLKAISDQLLAGQIELELTKKNLLAAQADRDKWMRIATKFTSQLGTIESVVAEAKTLALVIAAEGPSETDPSVKDHS